MAHLEDARRPSPAESVYPSLKISFRRFAPLFERILPALIAAALLALWEGAVRAAILSPLFFPAPSMIFATALRLFWSGALWSDVSATLTRVGVGFAAGGSFGLLLGLAMGWSRRLRVFVDPFIAAAHPLPKISVLPLLMLVFGIGETSKIILISVGTCFPMLLNAMAGVREISPIHFEVAQNYGASTLKLFTRVIAPGALPLVLTGVRVAFNIALLLTIAVEITLPGQGLGARIWLAWQTFRIEELYVALFALAFLGYAFNFGLQRLSAWLAPWRVEREV